MYIQTLPPGLEVARLEAIENFSNHLTSEISLALHSDGFFEPKYWDDYLAIKYKCQEASNKFYVALHEISK